jgi:TM2 domain-containing membrane protein YozV
MGAQVAILLGQLGIHKFILGYTNSGIIMLAVTLVSYVLTFVLIGIFGILAMSAIGIAEGIIYLTKSDDEFVVRYGVNRKSWF